jgi:hypothetical protein
MEVLLIRIKCKDNLSYPKFLANLTKIELRTILLVCKFGVIWIYLKSTLLNWLLDFIELFPNCLIPLSGI